MEVNNETDQDSGNAAKNSAVPTGKVTKDKTENADPRWDVRLNAIVETADFLASKAIQPPWFRSGDPALDCPDHENSGLALIDTGRSADWPVARLCEWPTAEFITFLGNNWQVLSFALRKAYPITQDGGSASGPSTTVPDLSPASSLEDPIAEKVIAVEISKHESSGESVSESSSVWDEQDREKAWKEVHDSLNREGKWNAGETGVHRGFFISGWNAAVMAKSIAAGSESAGGTQTNYPAAIKLLRSLREVGPEEAQKQKEAWEALEKYFSSGTAIQSTEAHPWLLANEIAGKIWEKRVYFRSVHKTPVVAIGEMARIINDGFSGTAVQSGVDAALAELRELFPTNACAIEHHYRAGFGTPTPDEIDPSEVYECTWEVWVGSSSCAEAATLPEAMQKVRALAASPTPQLDQGDKEDAS